MPTVEQLRDALEHIKYEVDMVNGLSAKLGSDKLDGEIILRNACLESMAIHLRSLESFLHMGQSNKPDDVYAKLYVASYLAPARDPTNNRERDYANKCVAHQTTMRAHNRPFGWQPWLAEIKVAYDDWRSRMSFGSGGIFAADPGELHLPPSSAVVPSGQSNVGSGVTGTAGTVAAP
jgi:hypothetical protein